MKWYRELFNRPNKREQKLLDKDIKDLIVKCTGVVNTLNKNRQPSEADKKCPHCKATDIVDRLQQVVGQTQNSDVEIDTMAVNHCRSCGNEWKKENVTFYFVWDVMEDLSRDLQYYLANPQYPIVQTLEFLNQFHAEAIHWVFMRHHKISNKPPLSELKTIFKSIYGS
jgi:hypothetical protein